MRTEQAISFHSITIGEKNTWDDWHLVPTERPIVTPPAVKTEIIELIGGDGFLDLTTNLSGKPTYQNRTGSWDFYVINPGQVPSSVPFKAWTALYSDIMGYLHGKKFDVILDDDPEWFYTGRLSVQEWSTGKTNSKIRINYNFEPYKRKVSANNITSF